jgi:hypothetical protein
MDATSTFTCPHCQALYHLVKVEAGLESSGREIMCRACGAPFKGAKVSGSLNTFCFGRPAASKADGQGPPGVNIAATTTLVKGGLQKTPAAHPAHNPTADACAGEVAGEINEWCASASRASPGNRRGRLGSKNQDQAARRRIIAKGRSHPLSSRFSDWRWPWATM